MKKTTMFRRMIDADEILIQPGVHDGVSALTGLETIRELEQKFLTRSQLESKYGNRPGAEH